MAEFREVIEQFKRLCDSANQDCSSCGLRNMSCSIKDIVDNSVEFEKRVMSWAAEHPEPVYETWLEFIKRFETGKPKSDNDFIYWMGTTSIPADIAEKLAIEPKEG